MRASQAQLDHTSATSSEFRRGWVVVLGAALGSGLGVSGLLTYNSGLFLKPLQDEIGLSRGGFGTAFFLATIAIALALPAWGRLLDRRGVLLPALLGSAALTAGFLALSALTHSVVAFSAIMAETGLFAGGCSPLPYTRAVSAAFHDRRGLALGLTQLGIGVSALSVPPLVGWMIANEGWRAAYLLLAALAALGVVPAWIVSRSRSALPSNEKSAPEADEVSLRGNAIFRLLFAAIAMMAVGFAGLLPHFVPMLIEGGVEPFTAAAYASFIGAAVIVSRVAVGWLVDRIDAAKTAAVACLLCAAGIFAFIVGGSSAAPVVALALGCAMGAEADLISFMTARYFGIANYGRAYAIQYAGFIVAAGLGPLWVGFVADWTGDYRVSCVVAALITVIAATLFLRLPSTRHWERSNTDGARAAAPQRSITDLS